MMRFSSYATSGNYSSVRVMPGFLLRGRSCWFRLWPTEDSALQQSGVGSSIGEEIEVPLGCGLRQPSGALVGLALDKGQKAAELQNIGAYVTRLGRANRSPPPGLVPLVGDGALRPFHLRSAGSPDPAWMAVRLELVSRCLRPGWDWCG